MNECNAVPIYKVMMITNEMGEV